MTVLTQSEKSLIKKSRVNTWRGAESKLNQFRIPTSKTSSQEKKHNFFQEEEGFDFRMTAIRPLVSAELRRFSPDSVIVHPPDVCCRPDISIKKSVEV